jgi:hypothetical protein
MRQKKRTSRRFLRTAQNELKKKKKSERKNGAANERKRVAKEANESGASVVHCRPS